MRHSSTQRRMTPAAATERDRGVVQCQVCCGAKSVEEAIVLWRDDEVVFAVCHACTGAHDIVMRPSASGAAGVEVLAKSRGGRPVPALATPYERVAALASRRIGPQKSAVVADLVRVAS